MRSSTVSAGGSILASQYDNLRSDAQGAGNLLCHQDSSPDMKVYVEPGVYYIAGTRYIFAGGDSPTITAPVSHPRIDLLTINSSGTLALVTGSENVSPVAPTYPTGLLVLVTLLIDVNCSESFFPPF